MIFCYIYVHGGEYKYPYSIEWFTVESEQEPRIELVALKKWYIDDPTAYDFVRHHSSQASTSIEDAILFCTRIGKSVDWMFIYRGNGKWNTVEVVS